MKKLILFAALSLMAAVSCKKQEYVVYDNPYVYVAWADDGSLAETSTVLAKANGAVRKYNFYLSSKKRENPLDVTYVVEHGDGLEEGVDYEVVTAGSSVTFDPGVYVASVELKFLRHTVTAGKDNTVTIRITGASEDIQIGIPGETPKNTAHTIRKIN